MLYLVKKCYKNKMKFVPCTSYELDNRSKQKKSAIESQSNCFPI